MSISFESLTPQSGVVTVTGRLDQTQSPELEEVLDDLLDQGYIRLIVDLGDVSYVNSGGLRCLVTGWRRANAADGDLVLCELTPRVKEVFAIVGFENVFSIFSNCGAARQAWQEQ